MVGRYWHFIPEDPTLSLNANFDILNDNFLQNLALQPGETLCELGCGLCRTGRDIAHLAGAKFIGVTLSPEEVALGNEEAKQLGRANMTTIIQGDYTAMPLDAGRCDAVLAVYTLKYSTPGDKLNKAFTEISRVLKPGGRFVSYEIITTEKYDEANETQAGWVHNISYHTGMPPLANKRHYREDAQTFGLKLVKEYDLEDRSGVTKTPDSFPFYFFRDYYLLVVQFIDAIGIKKGFLDYYLNFCHHPAKDFIASMHAGAVTCSTIFAYEKQMTTGLLDA
jgi:cyclopropane fatty-acyl-phospholipid synthase-like methyltransferase